MDRGRGQGWDEGQSHSRWKQQGNPKCWKGTVHSGSSRQCGGLGADFLITQGTSDTVPKGHEMFRDPKIFWTLNFNVFKIRRKTL